LQASSPLCHAHLHFVCYFSTWMYFFSSFVIIGVFFSSFGFLDFFPPFLELFLMIYSMFWFKMFVFKEWQGKLCHLKFRNGSSKWIFFGALFLPLNKYVALCIGYGSFQGEFSILVFVELLCVWVELCVLCEILCVEGKKCVCWINLVSHCGREVAWFWVVQRKIYWESVETKNVVMQCQTLNYNSSMGYF
jgi:hypothetical protein